MDTFVRFLNPLLMILAGLGAGVIAARRHPDAWRLYAAGVWTFILSQVFRIPFNSYVLQPLLGRLVPDGPVPGWPLFVIALSLGLSAGVFEEVARWIGYRYALPKARSWRDGLAYGAGHGGIEAVLIGLLTLYGVLQVVALSGPDAAAVLSPEQLSNLAQAEARIAAFWAAPWYLILLGALERVFAICFHLSASVLVLQTFRRGGAVWLAAAVAWHTLLDFSAVYISVAWGPYWAEALLAVMAALSLAVLFALRSPEEAGPPPGAPPEYVDLGSVDLSDEQIEDSRYG